MMNTLYLAISHSCNHSCLICPHRKKEDIQLSLEQTKLIVSSAIEEQHIERVVLSGGEPMLHPEFFDICKHLTKNGLHINVLTNGTCLSSEETLHKLCDSVSPSDIIFTISLHSHLEEINDRLAGRKGSYRQTLAGINRLYRLGYRVQIKHCVNKLNYRYLTDFLMWFEAELPPDIPINICNIDYCGMTKDKLQLCAISLTKVGKELNHALRKMSKIHTKRLIFISDTPLCTLHRNLWKYTEYEKMLAAYADPNVSKEGKYKQTLKSDVGARFPQCRHCRLVSVCHGTWDATIAYWGRVGIPQICFDRRRGVI